MSNVIIDIVTQFTGKKAFKDAENATSKLTGSVKKLAGAFGLAFGARAIVQFGRSSVNAFTEAEKASTRLANSVKNLGLSLSTADIQKNLDQISAKAGIAGEPLAAAYQSLLTTTGSVTKSQELFNEALDISRGSGIELETVTQDLSNAYIGITKGLKKYNLGLTQTELKTKTFAELSALLNKQFAGSNAKYLETYAGKMGVLGEAAGNAQEILGKGMIDALMVLSGDTTVAELADSMTDLAENTAEAGIKLAELGKSLVAPFAPIMDVLKGIYGIFEWIDKNAPKGLLEKEKPRPRARRMFEGGQDSVKAGQAAKAERLATKRAADLLKMQKASAKAAADALKLKKAGTLFDVEQANILAALKGNISKEEETRLKLQFAILTGNVSEASKLAGEVAKAQGLTKELVAFYSGIPDAKNPFAPWIQTLTDAEAIAKRIADLNKNIPSGGGTGGGTGGGATGGVTGTGSPAANLFQKIVDEGLARGESQATINSSLRYTAMGQKAMSGETPIVNVQVTLDGQEITGAVTKTQTNNYLSGKIIALERTLGSFG
jgi:hypothetical protein